MKKAAHTHIKSCSVIVACLTALVCSSQPNPLHAPTGIYIRSELNKIELLGDRGSWHGYQDKLDRLIFDGRGKINIVQIGGSHIQADMWSMQMRDRLQRLVPGVRGSRGFIFPYNIAKSNNPYWYFPEFTGNWTSIKNTKKEDEGALGLAGYAVTTHDTIASLNISFRGDMYGRYTFDRIKVLHRQDSSFSIDAFTRDTTISIIKVVNQEKGYTEFFYSAQVDTLNLNIHQENKDQLRFTLYGIIMENEDPGVIYHACGVNGASTTSWLRCERLSEELDLLDPDLVIFSIGINDAHDSEFSESRYKSNYKELIRRVRSVAPNAAILLTTNTDSYVNRKVPNKNADSVRRVMQQLSAEEGAAIWDTFGVMGGEGSIRTWEEAGLAKKDRVHFNRAGYTVLGDLLFSALIESYGDHIRKESRP